MIGYGYGVCLSPDLPEDAREWRNDPNTFRWCRQIEPLREYDHETWLKWLQGNDSVRMYSVVASVNDSSVGFMTPTGGKEKPVGVCGFTGIDHIHRTAEFSLYIASRYRGCKLGEKALQTLLHHGFKVLNLNRIWGEVFSENKALDLDIKLGFQKEGVLRQSYYKDGKYIDSVIISLLRSEFEKCNWKKE